jgi:dipeptidyl-peptidase-4
VIQSAPFDASPRSSTARLGRSACCRAFRLARPLALLLPLAGLGLLLGVTPAQARQPALVRGAPASLEAYLSPGFAHELVSATRADRLAWIEIERGQRNVYTAVPPTFEPVRLTSFLDDDGTDLTGLQLSADGRVAIFTRGHAANSTGWVANPDSRPEGAERAIWAVRTDGSTPPWRVTEASSALLSPDGAWVIWLRNGDIVRAAVTPPAPNSGVTDAPSTLVRVWGGATSLSWSPTGRQIAFVTNRDTHSFIGVYDLDARTVRYMSPSVDQDRSPTWSADGQALAFTRRPGRPFGQGLSIPSDLPRSAIPDGFLNPRFRGGHALEVWVADPSTGVADRVWHSRPGQDPFAGLGAVQWRGDALVFSMELGEWQRYYALPLPTPLPRPTGLEGGVAQDPIPLTHEVGFPEHVTFSADGRTLVFASNHDDIDRRHLWRVSTRGGPMERLTDGAGIETFPAMLASGTGVAYLSAGASRPQSVAFRPLEPGGAAGRAQVGAERLISRIPAAFPAAAHVTPTNVTLRAADGLEFHNQLFLPADLAPGERRPAMIFIHGGPRRQMLLGYNYGHFYHMAYGVNQYLTARGYIVLSINYRGGIGYGRTFRDAPGMGRNGNSEYQDLVAAGEYLRGRPDVDPSRVALWGLSYGGILTAQGLARNSDLFAAGADIAGVHFWGESLDPTTVNYRSSAVSHIDAWRSPVLLVHGDDDRNVAFSQTVGLVQLLRAREVPYELIVFPDEVHSFLVHQRWITTFEAMDAFFDRHLLGR